MDVVGFGVDIEEIERVERSVDKWGAAFTDLVFTTAEIESANGSFSMRQLTSRFAAKEAIVKAFGDGFSEGVPWKDMEITNEPSGKPVVKLSGRMLDLQRERQVTRVLVSLSYTSSLALASAMIVK